MFNKKKQDMKRKDIDLKDVLNDDMLTGDAEEKSTSKRQGRQVPGRRVVKAAAKKRLAIALGSVAFVLLVVYVGFSIFFNSHFYFRSTVNGVPASAASVDSVMKRVMENSKGYSLTVTGDDVSKDVITPEDIDLEVADDKSSFQKVLDEQNGFGWVGALIHPVNYDSDVVMDFDEDKLAAKIETLNVVTNKNQTKSEDAHSVFKGEKYAVVDEVYGTEPDMDKLKAIVSESILTMQKTLDLREAGCYIDPKVKADDKKLVAGVEALNSKLGLKFTYNISGITEKIPAETLASFLTLSDDLKVSYNDSAISEFVSEMAKKYNTAGKPKKLVTYTGAEVTVPGGSYGWKIDKAKEIEQIKADIDAGKDVNRDFVYSQTANSRGENDYGNSYIEVNRTGQKFCVYKDGACVLQSSVVTGNINKGRETHVGAYFIAYCDKDAILRGEDYESHVAYWMPFHNGEGFHDATWQPSFGGTYYKVRGSHGCVNLPLSVAKQLFSIVNAGYPVLIYDLPGTEDNAPNERDAAAFSNDLAGLGQVTSLAQKETVAAFRKRWDKLTPEAQSMVPNADILFQAEASIAAFEGNGTVSF